MEQRDLDFGTPLRAAARRALTVSALTARIQSVLETDFPDVWVEGEISNLTIAASGHWYFSLKDENAQIRSVVWKSATRLLRFKPKDGMRVLARGSVKVYAPKGDYQLSVEALEILGKGSLQQAFEELKERLAAEGLFDPRRKRSLPMLPRRIGVVTSPTGAAISDILRVLARRYQNLEVLVYPARVQGPFAAGEIVQGIRALNLVRGLDVLLLARGGGSLEELWPFNEEVVARAIAASALPTISAVGHETDFTIADFVADVRAPTPSAAAEQVVKAKEDLLSRLGALDVRGARALELHLTKIKNRFARVSSHRVFEAERGRVRTHAQTVDELLRRADSAVVQRLQRRRDAVRHARERLEAFRFDRQVAAKREAIRSREGRLLELLRSAIARRRSSLEAGMGRLESLSPLSVLKRGYALVFAPDGRIVRDPAEVDVGSTIRVRLRGGELGARVESKESS